MSPLFWVSAAVAAAIIEVLSPSFGFIFATFGALVSAAVTPWLPGWELQTTVFAVSLGLGLLLLRPMLLAKLQGSTGVPSRTEALVGKQGTVTEGVDPHTGQGRAMIEGQDWAVSSVKPLPVGSVVVVQGSDGIVLNVKEV